MGKKETICVSARIPVEALISMRPIWEKAYGKRGRSKWIAEQITWLLDLSIFKDADFTNDRCDDAKQFSELLDLGNFRGKETSLEKLSFVEAIVSNLESASRKMERYHGHEGRDTTISLIIRAAITLGITKHELANTSKPTEL